MKLGATCFTAATCQARTLDRARHRPDRARRVRSWGRACRHSAESSLNPLEIFNSPPLIHAPHAAPPFRLRARRTPDLAARKRPATYAAPEAAAAEGADRLRRSPFSRPLGRARSTAHKGRRVLRSTAPANSPKTPENSPNTEFSTLWKHFFHCVEKSLKVFPLRGKNRPVFPQCGKYFSIAWKNPEIVFHTVETFRTLAARECRELVDMARMIILQHE